MNQSTLFIVNAAANAFRIVANILIALIVTPIVFRQLGVELFGMLTTIGASGFLFYIFRGAVERSIQREIAFSIGRDDDRGVQEAFSSILLIQTVVAVLFGTAFLLLVPTLMEHLTIPAGYRPATRWCIHVVIAQFVVDILVSPFAATFAAHQHFRTSAFLNFLRDFSRLLAALLLFFVESSQTLVVYVTSAFLLTLPVLTTTLIVCMKRFPFARPTFRHARWGSVSSVLRYGSFAVLGGLTFQLRQNGASLFYNLVFGNLVAAANGIAIRISNLVLRTNGILLMTVQPAITTRAGTGKGVQPRVLALTSCFAFISALVISAPFLVDAEALIHAWLNELPEHAALFSRLICLSILISQISVGHNAAMHGHGKIGVLVTVIQGTILTFVCVAAYICWKTESNPWYILLGELVGRVLALVIFQPLWSCRVLRISYLDWIQSVVVPCLVLTALCTAVSLALMVALPPSVLRAALIGGSGAAVAAAYTWFILLRAEEKSTVRALVSKAQDRLLRRERPHPGPA